MENASKALLIAGTVLLAIMILSVGIILYNKYSETSEQYEKRLSTVELNKYNSNFEVFRDKTDITAQDIVTLANFVNNNNKNNSYPDVNITIFEGSLYSPKTDGGIEFLKEHLTEKFTCFHIGYNIYGLVDDITFTKTNE